MSSLRIMRMLLFFDLPTITGADKRNYRQFRKLLITNGFIMLQESVYCKMLTTPTVERSIKELIRKNKPPEGLIQTLVITEKQYARMEFVLGENTSDVISNEEKVVFL